MDDVVELMLFVICCGDVYIYYLIGQCVDVVFGIRYKVVYGEGEIGIECIVEIDVLCEQREWCVCGVLVQINQMMQGCLLCGWCVLL